MHQNDILFFLLDETSASKSTIINRIIGENELLPTKVRACTTKVCRIGYSNTYSISTKDSKGKKLTASIFRDKEELTEAVKDIATTDSPDSVYVDIEIPFSMLRVYDLVLVSE